MESASGDEQAPGFGTHLDDVDRDVVARLKKGDEDAFAELVETYAPSLTRVALMYVKDRESANDVVQETWLGVLGSIGRFEGRSSLKTWLFRILVKRALTKARRESRSRPFSALASRELSRQEPAVEPDRFIPPGRPGAGSWASLTVDWSSYPEERLEAGETMAVLKQAIVALPEAQRTVITLRDLEHWTASEVCNALEISETNQRVLLHRARSKVRRALNRYFTGEPS